MNIYDIAKEAGVSISTVSRVLNNKGKVKNETQIKIEKVLKKYNYTPSAIARGLVIKSMKTIGIMAIDIRIPHHATIAYIIEQEFSNNEYGVIMCNAGNSMKEADKYIKILIKKQVDGIVFIGSVFNEIMKKPDILTYLKDVPVVLANGELDIPNAYSVLVDDKKGIGMAVDYLYNKGHRNILYVKDQHTYSANLKEKGFICAMQEHNLYTSDKLIFNTQYGIEGGKKVAENIINSGIKFSGVVFGEDLTAIGAIKYFRKIGLKVPEDIAITGYNNSEYSEISEPELTSVDNRPEEMGFLVTKLLSNILEEKEYEDNILIQPRIVERESTVKINSEKKTAFN